MNMVNLLDVTIEDLLNKLADLDPESKEYEAVNDNLGKLMKHKIEIEKHLSAEAQAEKQLKFNETQAEKKLRQERLTTIWKSVIEILLQLMALGVTVWGTILMFTFEEKGTITSAIGRKFIDKIVKR